MRVVVTFLAWLTLALCTFFFIVQPNSKLLVFSMVGCAVAVLILGRIVKRKERRLSDSDTGSIL